jgi:hypothetical protein
MGVRPECSFVVACKLETEDGKVTDPRWVNLDLDQIEVFGPTKDHRDAILDTYNADPSNLSLFLEKQYIWAATGFAQLAEKEPGKKARELMAYDKMSNSLDWVGFVLSRLPYDNDALWALATIHQEYHSIDSFTELPLLSPEENCGEDAAWWRLAQEGEDVPYPAKVEYYQRLLDNGHNYSTFQLYVDIYIDKGMWFFNEILKFGLERKDLRLGVMWIWS